MCVFVCASVCVCVCLNQSTMYSDWNSDNKNHQYNYTINKNQVLELPLFTCMYQKIIEDHIGFNVQMVAWLTVRVPKGASIGINKYGF